MNAHQMNIAAILLPRQCKGTTYFRPSLSPTPIHFRPTPIRARNSGRGYATPNSVRNSNYI